MNKYIILLVLTILCSFLIGCWNYKEPNSIYIVAGVAIDKASDTGMFDITIEAVNMKDTDFAPNIESYKIETSGEAIFDAVRKMVRISSKKLYWSHAAALIVSEDVARESILPALDWIARDQETRLAMEILISKETTAKEILDTYSIATDIRTFELDIMTSESENLLEIPLMKVYQLINELSIPKTHPVIPVVEVNRVHDRMTNELSGAAVFNKDKMVGFLNNDDTLAYLFITNDVKNGLINVKNEERPDDTVILEIFKNTTKIKPVYTEDTIIFNIETFTDVTIGELNTRIDYISEPGREELKKLAEENLKAEIERIISKIRSEFGLDIFGFGNIIRQRNPRFWKEVEEDWDSIFQDLEFNINCNIHIKNSGHFSKPIEVVE